MLLIDGVKYEECKISNEDELEQMVIEHAQEIFGKNSIYFDKKQKLRSLAGVGSIPDGLVIVFTNETEWHIVEVELSSHDPYAHIVPQIDRFLVGIDNPNTRNKLVGVLFNVINGDELLKRETRQAIGLDKDIHKFLSDLIATPPTITIIIEKDTDQLGEALRKYVQKKVAELRTFKRVGAEAIHAHQFEPLYRVTAPKVFNAKVPVVSERREVTPVLMSQDTLQLIITNPSFMKFHVIYIPKDKRRFLPGFRLPFTLETDVGMLQTYMSSAPAGTRIGDPDKGAYFQANLVGWYRKHPELKVGDRLIIKAIEPMKKYRLEIVE